MQAGAAVVIPVIYSSCSKDDDVDVDPEENNEPEALTIDLNSETYSKLKTDGNAVIADNIIIANLGDEDFVALSAVCTHEGCIIDYNHSAGNFPCPCHGSVFSNNGAVVEGPASSAVQKYEITRDGSVLTIHN